MIELRQFVEYYHTHIIAFIEDIMGTKLGLWQKIYLSVLDKTRRHK